jgi:hypothetical protein
MNIRVQGPDGVILEFPAGTDPGIMKSAMQKRYGGPQAPVAEGDWEGLAQRVQTAGETLPSGMVRESAMAEQGQRNRMEEARTQGQMYGAAQGPVWVIGLEKAKP